MRSILLSALLLCLHIPQARSADPIKDPAELMPAGTLAYLELNQPGPLAKEIASLFEGTALANVPDSLLDLFEKMKVQPSRGQREEMGGVGLALAPEVVKEVQRLQGAAIALTSVANGKPEFIAVILPGESNAPAFMMRAFMTMERTKVVDTVEGVKLYQYAPRQEIRPPEFKPGVPQDRPQPIAVQRDEPEPAFAMMPGALFIGTADAVKEAIRRAKGKSGDPSLASLNKYKDLRKEVGGQAGLFGYVDLSGAVGVVEKLLPLLGQDAVAGMKAVDQMVNFKAFRAAGYSASLEKGTLRYRELVLLDPKEKSPVLELLPSKAAKTELLHFTPSDTILAVVLSNANGAERWTKALKMCDAVTKLTGGGKAPSEDIAKMEKALGIDIGKDVMGKITDISLALGDVMKAPVKRIEEEGPGFKRTRTMPEIPVVFVLQATDAEAATNIVDKLLPKVLGALTGKEEVKPDTKEVGGHKLSSVKVDKHASIHYGREGKTIVLGMFPAPVAQALTNGAKQKGWLSEAKVKAREKEFEDSMFICAARPVSLMAGMLVPFMGSMVQVEKRAVGDPAKPQRDEEKPTIRETVEKPIEMPKEFKQIIDKEELLVGRVSIKGDRVLEEWTLPGLKPLVGQLVQFGMEMSLQQRAKAPPPRGFPEKAPDRNEQPAKP